MTIKDFMTNKHRECDHLLTQAEDFLDNGEFDEALGKYIAFKNETLLHFAMEEEYLFPMLEEKSGMGNMGPTNVMRMEHTQAKSLFEKMDEAYNAKDKERAFALGESMNILLQQHNLKEEQMLYTMMNNTLAQDAQEIVEKLQDYGN
ncbi:hemerythrin domain-containing protein [Sulfurimonas autotrophica]|uniref:Hemerythrin HHE cation binding domain protein n=1 Tax=Sulfurimonas autotrophica (strain ATCC BAA-671 / DSM 16294 / JCM 11897 / OK10) TaxID=563040 RepID=E0UQB7_SULAO|nr:hemerythrin domain-containing protein [Sulfurimonas autotrophica]ADN09860.1 Hemerythrin HHE cation binding domain protein [Sulfurimonas autotrophica DSM 16294]